MLDFKTKILKSRCKFALSELSALQQSLILFHKYFVLDLYANVNTHTGHLLILYLLHTLNERYDHKAVVDTHTNLLPNVVSITH